MPLSADVDLSQLSKNSAGYSGADIEAVSREAAMIALRRNKKAREVTLSDFRDAMSKIKPSITPDILAWYQSVMKRVAKEKVAVPVT